jgi:thiol:disulfide interchange protein DsbA
VRLLLTWLCLLATPLWAMEPMEGADYVVLEPRVALTGRQIEVVEFFYYGCGACDRFEPVFEEWRRKVGSDVQVRRVPVSDNNLRWVSLARLYFTLEQLNLVDVLHGDVFRAIHQRNLKLSQRDEQIAWAREAGLDEKAFVSVLESPEVGKRVDAAREMLASYHVTNTPTLVIHGQFLTSGAITGDLNALIPVTEALIEKIRRARDAVK